MFFVCDIQETFRGKMQQWPLMVAASVFLTQVASSMKIPVVVTEQKPFKPTIAELDASLALNSQVFRASKTLFSMATPEVLQHMQTSHPNVRHIYVYGMETHVCVLQTTLDLLRHGFIVHLPTDAITSMHEVDRAAALVRFQGLAATGCVLTSAESAVFELARDASLPLFKPLVPFVKEYAAAKIAAAEALSKRSNL